MMNQVITFDNTIIADEKNHTQSDITLSSDATWEGWREVIPLGFVKKQHFAFTYKEC